MNRLTNPNSPLPKCDIRIVRGLMAGKRKVTLKDIADKAGLTRMAVSLALRNRPGVSSETRQRVLKIAEKLGYEPDPEVSNLMARIRASKPAETKACIALLSSGPMQQPQDLTITERKYIEGVIDRAKTYGYGVEGFHIGDGGLTPDRASSILWNRGIEGVVLRPLQYGLSEGGSRSVEFDFDRFSSVAISETIATPELDRALHDQYTAMLITMNELTRLNYRSIGLVVEESLNLRVNGRWSAAFLQFQHFSHDAGKVPPLILDRFDPKRFSLWFKRHKPDVLVSVNRFGLRFAMELGLRIPEDVAYASLDVDYLRKEYPHMAGIDQNSHLVGAAAVDMLVVSIQRRQRGIPLHPVRIEVEGEWRSGSSAPEKKRR